jgi:hypothetical protein
MLMIAIRVRAQGRDALAHCPRKSPPPRRRRRMWEVRRSWLHPPLLPQRKAWVAAAGAGQLMGRRNDRDGITVGLVCQPMEGTQWKSLT